jgi:DNA (cytosine-5)-methyltransferase 1
MRLLDLFCGAGGAGMGYHRAGFDVVGVDINPQPRYPFEFHQADAMTFPLDGYDVIHASPPCQAYSSHLRHMATPQSMLIDAVIERLHGHTWVVENVEGAPLPDSDTLFGEHGLMLCGTSFGLRIYRHRLFQTSTPITGALCDHRLPHLPVFNPHNADARERMYVEFDRNEHAEARWAREMGVEWMNRHEAREAIPPAYTQHIGEQLLASLRTAA